MKAIILAILILLTHRARADVISVNDEDKTVYFHPRPNLEMNLQNLDSAGGILYLSLSYTAQNARTETDDLAKKYPGYQVTALVATPSGTANLRIADIVTAELPMQQQQVGPYINSSLQLSVEQTKKLIGLGDNLAAQTQMSLPVSFQYRETQVLERYVADGSVCGAVKAKTLRAAIVGLFRLQKPPNIKFDSTLESLKEDMLNKCFVVDDASVQSFSDLLNVSIAVTQASENLVGVTRGAQNATKNVNLAPIVKSTLLR